MARKFGMGLSFFGGGCKFWSRDFFGFCLVLFEAQGIFWVLIFAPIRSFLPLEICSAPPGNLTPNHNPNLHYRNANAQTFSVSHHLN